MMKAFACLFALSLFSVAHAQSNSTAAAAVKISRDGTQLPSFGNCSCDLTVDSCDLFCCCDASCSATNKAQFAGQCREKVPSSVLPLCLSSNTFVKINANTLKDSPLCIERSNSPLLGEFHPPPPSTFSASDVASGKLLHPPAPTQLILLPPSALTFKRASLSNVVPPASLSGPYAPGKLLTAAGGGFFTFLQRAPDGTCAPAPVAFFADIPPTTCYLSASVGASCANFRTFL
jgi:hypothetical protein